MIKVFKSSKATYVFCVSLAMYLHMLGGSIFAWVIGCTLSLVAALLFVDEV